VKVNKGDTMARENAKRFAKVVGNTTQTAIESLLANEEIKDMVERFKSKYPDVVSMVDEGLLGYEEVVSYVREAAKDLYPNEDGACW
jgi:hypothetical protein